MITKPTSSEPRSRRKNYQAWIISGTLLTFAAVLLIAGSGIVSRLVPAPKQNLIHDDTALSKPLSIPGGVSQKADLEAESSSNLVDDDGQSLWASPTDGRPIDLGYLPPGVQIVVSLRLKDILAHPESEKILAALGPSGERGIEYVEQTTSLSLRKVNHLIIAIQASAAGNLSTTLVASLDEPISLAQLYIDFPTATEQTHANETYLAAGDLAYFLPANRAEKLVIAPAAIISEIIDLEGSPPPLRRDMERLVAHTDANRQVTILVAPNFLFGEGQGMFARELARLREPLFWFLGDEFSAAALSLHWDDNFFAELIAVPTLDTLPERASQILAERVSDIPDYIEEYVLALSPSDYGRRVVARFPEMIRELAAYTRRENDRDVSMLRCYLPAIAGHNLLMAAELTLAEPLGKSSSSSATEIAENMPTSPAPNSIAERLQQKASLRFARDTLEVALNQLSKEIGTEITILGPDLQLEGITKNQSFGIDISDRPAEEILVEILRQSNPDKTAIGPADPRQKLVYVVRPSSASGPEAIVITTRARAAERGDKLPKVFTELAK